MKSNMPIIIAAAIAVIVIAGLVVTGEYERFLPIDTVDIEYAPLEDYGYESGFNYNYIEENETQEQLEAEYYRENTETGFDDEDFDIVYNRVSATNSSNEIFNYGLQGNALYPGAMILAIQTDAGALISIPSVQRGSATFSINQEGTQTSGSLSAKVSTVNQSNVRSAINSIIEGKDLSQFTTIIDYQYQTIKSSNEFDLKIGADVNIRDKFNISDKFTSKSSTIATRAVMVVKQICFEVTMDHPESLSAFFNPSWATADKIRKAFGTEATPLYVSGVAYGRTLIITAESTLDETTLKNTLTAGFKSSIIDIGLSNTIASMTSNNETSISVQVIGGNSQDAIGIIKAANGILSGDVNSILDNFSYSSATPIMYRISNLDGSAAMIQSANEYVIQTLVPNSHRVLDWNSLTAQMTDASKGNGLIDGNTLKLNIEGMTIDPSENNVKHVINVPSNVERLVIKSSESLIIPNFSLLISPSSKSFDLELHNFSVTGSEDIDLISFTGRQSYELHSNGTVSLIAADNRSALYSDGPLVITGVVGSLSIQSGDRIYSETYETTDESYAIECRGDLSLVGSGSITIIAGNGYDGVQTHKNGGDGCTAIKTSNLIINSSNRITIYGGNGGDGCTGDDGQKGSDGIYQDIVNTNGKPGTVGGTGGNGGNGGALVDSNTITIISGKIIAYVGAGGNGGNGGAGGNGGNGSSGIIWHGVGGDGGNGGAGGNGGNMGPSLEPNPNITIYEPNYAEGGKGGPGGKGGNGGTYLGVPNSSGSNGKTGKNGLTGQ